MKTLIFYFFFFIYWVLGLISVFCEQVQISLSCILSKFIKMPICADENYIPEANGDLIQLSTWQLWVSHTIVIHEQGETNLMYG